MRKLNYYIGERWNPQFEKPYYVAYGQLTKTSAKSAALCIYGSMILKSYESHEVYNKELQRLKSEGFSIHYK